MTRFGCAWYPEHWPEGRWPEDLSLMRDAGMNVVRVAEFAWSRMEPEEGRYEFDWLERAIQRAADAGLDTVLGTPTAAPPAWMTSRYPEVLAVRESGHPERHGARGHHSPANPPLPAVLRWDRVRDGGAFRAQPARHRLAD